LLRVAVVVAPQILAVAALAVFAPQLILLSQQGQQLQLPLALVAPARRQDQMERKQKATLLCFLPLHQTVGDMRHQMVKALMLHRLVPAVALVEMLEMEMQLVNLVRQDKEVLAEIV
jgi:hypothetical protein